LCRLPDQFFAASNGTASNGITLDEVCDHDPRGFKLVKVGLPSPCMTRHHAALLQVLAAQPKNYDHCFVFC
jgi:hypothetical protein